MRFLQGRHLRPFCAKLSAALGPLLVGALIGFAASADAQAAPSNGAAAAAAAEALQKGELAQARDLLLRAADENPRCASCFYNLGLVESRAGSWGLALAYWRRALWLDPGYSAARRASNWGLGKLERRPIPNDPDLWSSFQELAIEPAGKWAYGWAACAFFFAACWAAIERAAKRKRVDDEGEPDEGPPAPAPLGAMALAALFALAASLQAAKLSDLWTVRATIVAKRVEARSAPDSGGAPLFDLFEGLEVVVRQSKSGWAQVAYPGGASGWVPLKSIFVSAGELR